MSTSSRPSPHPRARVHVTPPSGSSSTSTILHHILPLPRLTVRLLESGTGARTTELLGLAAAVVGNEQCTVVLAEGLLEQVLAVLVDELLVVGDQGLGDRLTNGVDLGGVTTAADADADVDVGELIEAED